MHVSCPSTISRLVVEYLFPNGEGGAILIHGLWSGVHLEKGHGFWCGRSVSRLAKEIFTRHGTIVTGRDHDVDRTVACADFRGKPRVPDRFSHAVGCSEGDEVTRIWPQNLLELEIVCGL
jgi:hypothetical protein